ncbi:MAG: GNAT family N-acetyltransferase [Thermodesulfobacteriota bacterium]|jgi:GNAT superfamily N-acetyltransferase
MKSEVVKISGRFKKARIGVKNILSVIDMTLEDHPKELASLFPYDVFEGLDELVNRTVHGTKIERIRPQERHQLFHTFEIHTEEGEVLGYLNMIFLRKPIPCYYLVYVEVLLPFRGRGLGQKILQTFRELAEGQGVVGLLDNIIPPDEPTYDIYTKLGWRRIEELTGDPVVNGEGHYMVFIPSSVKVPDLRGKLIKLLFKVRKKRPVIDMHDNEAMVKRAITEFRSVYEALEHLFEIEISAGTSTPFMHFMFTKFVTKVLGFRRRIASLLGYTGGESLDQISISDQIKNLPIQPYSLWWAKEEKAEIWGEEEIVRHLPQGLKENPTLYIEDLPLYKRPYLSGWVERKGDGGPPRVKISDLLELGFDPTKLKEFRYGGVEYIFERTSPRSLSSVEQRKRFLEKIGEHGSRVRFHHGSVQTNPPLVILQDRGNVYILRRKVEGIHSEECLDQLRTSPHLKEMNREAGIDRVVVTMINEIKEWLWKVFDSSYDEEIEELTFFVPWDLQKDMPRLMVDDKGVSLHNVWIA